MRLDDGELRKELYSAKSHMKELVARKAPNSVIQRAEFQVEILEELSLWRENGKKWLKILVEDNTKSLSDTMFAGEKENHGQVFKSAQGANKVNS